MLSARTALVERWCDPSVSPAQHSESPTLSTTRISKGSMHADSPLLRCYHTISQHNGPHLVPIAKLCFVPGYLRRPLPAQSGAEVRQEGCFVREDQLGNAVVLRWDGGQ